MSTVIRPELSQNNSYHISKHRYYELKHFCLQYHEWESARRTDILKSSSIIKPGSEWSDPVGDAAAKNADIYRNMKLVRDAALSIDGIGEYIFKAVTDGYSYNYLRTKLGMPCGKSYYYEKYRKFFWVLNERR